MSYDAVPSEKSVSCRCNDDPMKIREVATKSITQRRMERNNELRQYKKKLIAYVERELDKKTQKCEPIAIELHVSTLSYVGGYNVPEWEVMEILKAHYE